MGKKERKEGLASGVSRGQEEMDLRGDESSLFLSKSLKLLINLDQKLF